MCFLPHRHLQTPIFREQDNSIKPLGSIPFAFEVAEIRLNEVVYQALCATFDHLSTAVFILTPDGFILFANQTAKSMLEEGDLIRSAEGYLEGKERALSK